MTMKIRELFFMLGAAALLSPARARAGQAPVDLATRVLVTPPGLSGPEGKAVALLADEVEKRTQLRWRREGKRPAEGPVVVVGTAAALRKLPGADPAKLAPAAKGAGEGYSVWVERGKAGPTVWVAGNDSRGVLFGVGRLPRGLRMERRKVTLRAGFKVATAPQAHLRGHQLGYRPKTNSYDGWTLAMWEQYIRDLAVFGTNAVELIPPRSDDAEDSPHFPMPPLGMMIGMSQLLADYGHDVWIWYPAMDADYRD